MTSVPEYYQVTPPKDESHGELVQSFDELNNVLTHISQRTTGPQGEPGPIGLTGSQGSQGDRGIQGVPGEDAEGNAYYSDFNEVDQGIVGGGNTIKAFVDAIVSNNATISLKHNSGGATTVYTLDTDEDIPVNIKLRIEPGAIIDGTGTLTISSMDDGFHQRFGSSITILFNAGDGTSQIHPEWWGEFPNGYSDHGALNKAIAAANSIGSASGYDDPEIVVRPGRYYVAHNTLSTIKTNFRAPNTYFSAINNSVADGSLFKLDFSEWPEAHNIVEIGTVLGRDTMVIGGTHYNYAVQVLAGDTCTMKIGALLGVHTGLLIDASIENKHIGMWNIDIGSVGGCERGTYVQCGDDTGVSAGVEGMKINIHYSFYTDLALELETDVGVVGGTPIHITGCQFNINGLEIHYPANLNGIRVSGVGTHSNTIKVPGSFMPSATCNMLTMANDAYDNLFEFCHFDWGYITNTTGGYNIFRATSNVNMTVPALSISAQGRSEIMGTAAPTSGQWRQGDRCWNTSFASITDTLFWTCSVSGAPGTWLTISLHDAAHTIASHSDTTATGAELNELTDGSDTTLHDHDGISENSAARHAESHTVVSHSDTDATGAELDELTDNSIADTLHRHSELVAPDGSPDPALSVDNDGDITMVGTAQIIDSFLSEMYLRLNYYGSGNRYAIVDLVGDDTHVDYGLRLLRNNTGANTDSHIQHRGTGKLLIRTDDAGDIELGTNSLVRLTISSAGKITLSSGTDINEFSIDGTLAGNSDDAVPTEKAVKTFFINNGGFQTLDDTGTPSVSGGSLFLTGGTTAITFLDDGVAGQIVTILNDSDNGLVMTDGAAFHLNTNADWTTYHRQTLTMLCTPNSEWVEIARGYQT